MRWRGWRCRLPPLFRNCADHSLLSQVFSSIQLGWVTSSAVARGHSINCISPLPPPIAQSAKLLAFYCFGVILQFLPTFRESFGSNRHFAWISIFVTLLSAIINHEHRNGTSLYCVTKTENVLNWIRTHAGNPPARCGQTDVLDTALCYIYSRKLQVLRWTGIELCVSLVCGWITNR